MPLPRLFFPRHVAGAASALLNSSRQLGTAVGLAVIGVIGAAATREQLADLAPPQNPDHVAAAVSGRTTELPIPLHDAAVQAFSAGYHTALLSCCACAIAVGAVACWVFRPQRRRNNHKGKQ